MKTRIRLAFKSDPALLEAVRALTAKFLRNFSLSHERIQEIVLAVDEACSNAIRHAYANRPSEEIVLLLRSDGGGMEVVVADKGKPMPQEKVKAAKGKPKKVSPQKVRPGGLGLKLMHRVFDEVHITTGEKKGNRVRMRLFF